jgi:hypothetical protein
MLVGLAVLTWRFRGLPQDIDEFGWATCGELNNCNSLAQMTLCNKLIKQHFQQNDEYKQ